LCSQKLLVLIVRKMINLLMITEMVNINKDATVEYIRSQREQIQEDILCILDGLDQERLDNVCQVVVDRFQCILLKMDLLDRKST